jgi:hypothetical protein
VNALIAAALFHAAYDFCLFMDNYPFLFLGAFVALILGVWLSLRAIRLHNLNSPFSNHVLIEEEKV